MDVDATEPRLVGAGGNAGGYSGMSFPRVDAPQVLFSLALDSEGV